MENYEQKYKEALEWVRSIYPTMQGTDKEDAEHYFPELRESEDERIRKEIIKLVHFFYGSSLACKHLVSADDMISWLEKQGEQKFWSEEDELMIQDAIHWINEFQKSNRCKDENDMQNSVTCENWLKSLKDRVHPQPKQEWSEEDMKQIRQIERIVKDSGASTNLQKKISDWLKSIKPNHWKPSEEQMEAFAIAVHDAHGRSYYKKLFSFYNDLKKL